MTIPYPQNPMPLSLLGNPPLCADTDAQVLMLTGLLPADTSQPRAVQARSVLERMGTALQRKGMTFAHVVRTWFYLDRILEWYDAFNAVRSAFFTERDVFAGVLPASTGVGMANPAGAALVAGVLAVKPVSPRVSVFAVPSPLQCPAPDYRSAFSRAVEVQIAGRRHLYISGTASIDPHGASAHCGDLDGQINLTMAVAGALLESRHMTWADATQAIAYFKDLAGAPRLTAYCRDRGFAGFKAQPLQATLCRDDLLFEVEIAAAADQAATPAVSGRNEG